VRSSRRKLSREEQETSRASEKGTGLARGRASWGGIIGTVVVVGLVLLFETFELLRGGKALAAGVMMMMMIKSVNESCCLLCDCSL
jgi:predicted metalloprotease